MTIDSSLRIIGSLRSLRISEERKSLLRSGIDYLVDCHEKSKKAHLIFVCTHNSRRSQMAQFWAHYLAEHYGLAIFAYSGGTEVTALAPQAAKAIEDLGFDFEIQKGNQSNPKYRLKFDSAKRELILYSKLFTEITDSLPAFTSLMCCSQAEETCPYVPGTELRIALNYEDPKHADGTESETATYHECLMKIGSETNYILSEVAKRVKK